MFELLNRVLKEKTSSNRKGYHQKFSKIFKNEEKHLKASSEIEKKDCVVKDQS
jgi:hypothetical protein